VISATSVLQYCERISKMRIQTRSVISFLWVAIICSTPFLSGSLEAITLNAQTINRPNVLFIAVDDLRPQLACYGQSQMRTPNFDALAKRSVLFERAYCMVPTCGASRASLMTGIRPSPSRFVSYTARADRDMPDAMTLNTFFKENGYTTISLGKVFHFVDDSLAGWSEDPWRSKLNDYQNESVQRTAVAQHQQKYPNRKKVRAMPYESADALDSEYRDYETATQAITRIKQFAESKEPFFLAVGFNKPHLPFCAPKRYWDLYSQQDIQLAENDGPPLNAPEGAVHASGELRAYASIPPTGPVSQDTARQLIHGYYACVSFIDAQLGRLIQQLDDSGLANNTIIVLWGDHGWQLGEHGMWNKHSCFETSMHAPLMIAAPGFVQGERCRSLTEFIDIYPTLCELSGFNAPSHVQGVSLIPWLKNPKAPGKANAIGRFQTGDTVRTDSHRYSEYRTQQGRGRLTGAMLYDHRIDPGENQNLSGTNDVTEFEESLRAELAKRKGRD